MKPSPTLEAQPSFLCTDDCDAVVCMLDVTPNIQHLPNLCPHSTTTCYLTRQKLGMTAMHIAASKGFVDMMRVLMCSEAPGVSVSIISKVT